MMTIDIICECCGIFKAVGVGGSILGPFSFAYCRKCLQFNAEPLWIIETTVHDINGGWEHVAEWVRDITVPIGPGIYIYADQLI